MPELWVNPTITSPSAVIGYLPPGDPSWTDKDHLLTMCGHCFRSWVGAQGLSPSDLFATWTEVLACELELTRAFECGDCGCVYRLLPGQGLHWKGVA